MSTVLCSRDHTDHAHMLQGSWTGLGALLLPGLHRCVLVRVAPACACQLSCFVYRWSEPRISAFSALHSGQADRLYILMVMALHTAQ